MVSSVHIIAVFSYGSSILAFYVPNDIYTLSEQVFSQNCSTGLPKSIAYDFLRLYWVDIQSYVASRFHVIKFPIEIPNNIFYT